jgi:hypothetical protein
MLGSERADEKEGAGEGWRAGGSELLVIIGGATAEEGPATAE